jgi:hypothetical protein
LEYLPLYAPRRTVTPESEVHTVHGRPLCTLQIVYSVHCIELVLYPDCTRGLAQFGCFETCAWSEKYNGKDNVNNFFCFQYFRRRCVTF